MKKLLPKEKETQEFLFSVLFLEKIKELGFDFYYIQSNESEQLFFGKGTVTEISEKGWVINQIPEDSTIFQQRFGLLVEEQLRQSALK